MSQSASGVFFALTGRATDQDMCAGEREGYAGKG